MIQIYEVESTSTGAGNYVCKRLDLDGSKWTAASGDRFIDAKEDSVNVFNIMENNVISGAEPALAAGDRLMAWDVTDGDGVIHYVGRPITPEVRMAKATENAPDAEYITCNLFGNDGGEITSGLGSGIHVYRKVPGDAVSYNGVVPRFASGGYLFCQNIRGVWYWIQIPTPSKDGTC